MSRRFSRAQRNALFQASEGRCANCGKPLGQSFHADHVYPYAKGGVTDVLNGQALCADCNLKKGDNLMGLTLRQWQIEEHQRFLAIQKKWFMLVATPGAGKTAAMLNNANTLYQSKEVDAMLVVVPSEHLKRQWKSKAKDFGLRFIASYEGYFNAKENDGIAITYQQLASSPEVIRAFFRNRKVFVILDEPHHMGEEREWGKKAAYALETTHRGIMGSGTPFRSDDNYIPFVSYTNDVLDIDYRMSYGDALSSELVRAIYFRKINVNAEWMSYDNEIMTAGFDDELKDPRKQSERLNAAISPRMEWLKGAIRQAVSDLRHIRHNENPDSQMLIVCKDTRHAEEVSKLYKEVAKTEPTVVSTSPDFDHEGSEAIEQFAKGLRGECIISVNMITEGVDIPRLRCLVWATNKVTRLFFEQTVGRVVRVEKGRELENALVYLPSDPRLLEFAQEIKDARQFVVEKRICKVCGQYPCVCPDDEPKPPPPPKPESLFLPFNADPVFAGGLYLDTDFTEQELKETKSWLHIKGWRIPVEEGIRIRRDVLKLSAQLPEQKQPGDNVIDTEKLRQELRNRCQKLASILAKRRNVDVQEIHLLWIVKHDGSQQKDATIDELQNKLKWLKSQLEQ